MLEDVPGTQEGGENTGCGDSTTSTATNSSGIGSGMSIKSSENSDTMSVSSGGIFHSKRRILNTIHYYFSFVNFNFGLRMRLNKNNEYLKLCILQIQIMF
jgi:hypothetical protein